MTVQKKEVKAVKGSGLFQGVTKTEKGMEFTISCEGEKTLILTVYLKDGRQFDFKMNEFHISGNLYSVLLTNFNYKYFEYTYRYDGQWIKDAYAGAVSGVSRWGEPAGEFRYCYRNKDFDWEGDKPLMLSMHSLVMYKLHVRGFTKHLSSGVRHKGTFAGVTEKIDYLKNLGINCVELMPVAEFEEMVPSKKVSYQLADPADIQYKMNFWGYGDAHYFAPKSSYSASQNAAEEFKTMVLKLHQAGIEVVLDFAFAKHTNKNMILDCLRYWVHEYHVDGFHVNSNVVPVELVISDPMLAQTKIFTEGFGKTAEDGEKPPYFKHLAEYHDEYAVCCRRFLKGDEDMVSSFERLLVKNDAFVSSVQYICGHNGMRLADLVMYDQKHNEANGENNSDGTDFNYSWNCGEEGPTRKKKVKALRLRQMKNAWMFAMFHQGIPLICAGDEFGQSQEGNNNPYCQDNEYTWLNWKNIHKNRGFFEFASEMIALRKHHPVLHSAKPVRLMDYLGCGFPDVSYHGGKPWQIEDLAPSRYLGVLYGGRYGHENGRDDDYLYFAYNMYWEPKLIGLPALPGNMTWQQAVTTWDETADHEEKVLIYDAKTSEISSAKTDAHIVTDGQANEKDTGAGQRTRTENTVIYPRTITVFKSVVRKAKE